MIGRVSRFSHAAGTRRQRFVPAVLFLRLTSGLVLAGTLACRSTPSADFPVLDEGVAPEVQAAVKSAHDRVHADPTSSTSWLALGMVCEANGLSAEARRAYEKAVTLDGGKGDPRGSPNDQARAWYRLAVTRARAGQIDEALAAVDRSIALDGGYAPAYWRRGLWLLDLSKESDARAAFEKATTLDPSNPGGWVGLARVALLQKRAAEAVELLEKFLSQHPGDRYALHLLGTAYQRLGRADEAEYALAIGATGEPVWPDPWSDDLQKFRVGFAQTLKDATAHLLNGNYNAAIPLLERLSRERPDDLSLSQQLGLSYVAAGRSADGLGLLRKALERDPNNLETHLRLASAYVNTQDFAQALAHAERAVALGPELGRAHETKAMALWRGGRPLEALDSFRQALRYDPKNISSEVSMGWILIEAGRPEDALPHFARAAERNPMLAEAFVGIGVVNLQRGQLNHADEALQRAARLDPNNPRLAKARAQLDEMKSRAGRRG